MAVAQVVVEDVAGEARRAAVVQAVVAVTISVLKLKSWSAFQKCRDGTTKGVQNK